MSDSNRTEVLFQLFIKKMNKLKQKITDTDYQQQLQDEWVLSAHSKELKL